MLNSCSHYFYRFLKCLNSAFQGFFHIQYTRSLVCGRFAVNVKKGCFLVCVCVCFVWAACHQCALYNSVFFWTPLCLLWGQLILCCVHPLITSLAGCFQGLQWKGGRAGRSHAWKMKRRLVLGLHMAGGRLCVFNKFSESPGGCTTLSCLVGERDLDACDVSEHLSAGGASACKK